MTGVFVPLVPVAQCSMVSKALSHSGSLHQQDFVDLKTASSRGEDWLDRSNQWISYSQAFYIICPLSARGISHLSDIALPWQPKPNSILSVKSTLLPQYWRTWRLIKASLGINISDTRPKETWKSFHALPLPGSKAPPSWYWHPRANIVWYRAEKAQLDARVSDRLGPNTLSSNFCRSRKG